MSVNERIKLLRKEKGLNQKQFASMLGMTQSGVSYIEKSGSSVSDSKIKEICSIFGVSEEWMRNGTEPIFETSSIIENLVKQHGGTEMDVSVLKSYFNLDVETRKSLFKFFAAETENMTSK